MSRRLPPVEGEWIDRERSLAFTFEGEPVRAFEGDVITSALLAAGHVTLGRSFKYHRPRGVLSAANHDANVLLESARATHVRADVEPPEAGAAYHAVNTLGGLRFDAARALGLLSPVLPVGFYYKAFYRPRFAFPWWERLIRRLAGLGRVDPAWRTPRLPRRHRWCDVLVIGAGPAGLGAAAALADSGLDVVLADENAHCGGSLGYAEPRDAPAADGLLARVTAAANVEVLTGHFAAGCYEDLGVPLVGADGIVHAHPRALVVATGVYEQPAVFRNNDAPGVMLASAAQRLLRRYAVAPCERACVVAGNDSAYAAALALAAHGVEIAAIADLDDPSDRGDLAARAIAAGIQVIPRARIAEARTRGGRLAGVRLDAGAGGQSIDCDGLLVAVGWAAAAGLLHQAGARLAFDADLGQVVPAELPAGVFAAGRVNGVFELAARIADGRAAAAEAGRHLGLSGVTGDRPPRDPHARSHPYPVVPHPRGKDFVDFDEDLTVRDLLTGAREGFDSVELLKRYSTIGMGPSQGKTSNMNGLRILARHTGRPVGAVGATTPRPFTHPVPIAALAGRRVRRCWRTPIHAWHAANGADLREAGTWLRPMSYRAGSPRAAVEHEYRVVRERVGLIDVSTLGKIEVFGPDAVALLEYAYTCGFDRLAEGMTRYVFSVDGSGTLVDDGIAARFADDHLYLTATSSHAQAAVRALELYAAQLALDVHVLDRTFEVGAVNLAGPRSREVLARLTSLALDEAAFPYLAIRSADVAGISARLMRVGFVGELGYEIHVPANSTGALWDALLEAGAGDGIEPFGVEAQRLLRLEKGHLLFGQDTDGTTNPFEANLGWGVRLSKPRFVGRHSLAELKPRVSRRLVGFETTATAAGEIRECHLVIDGSDIAGRVTSVARSPHRNAVIGLAMVPIGMADTGTRLGIRVTDGTLCDATVVDTPFYDPDNARQRPEATDVENAA